MRFWLIAILVFFAIRYLLPIVLRLVLSSFVRKQMRNGGFVVPPPARPRYPTRRNPRRIRAAHRSGAGQAGRLQGRGIR